MKILKTLKKLKLSESEKDGIYVRIRERTGIPAAPIKSPYVFLGYFKGSHFKFAIAAISVFILTATATFASKALPGDLLYPVKINVIEKLPDAIAWSNEAKAKRNSKKIESRIEEFEALANNGTLNDKKAAVINIGIDKAIINFDRHLDRINKSRAEVKDMLDSNLKERINIHKEKIIDIKKTNNFIDPTVLDKVLKRADKSEEKEEKENKREEKSNSKDSDTKKEGSLKSDESDESKDNKIKIELDIEKEIDDVDEDSE